MLYFMNENINKFIDQTLLKVDANEKDIITFCSEAELWDFASVCIYPCWVVMVKKRFPSLRVSSVVGFPSGASTKEQKLFEASRLIDSGIDEIDMVMNIGFFKSKMALEVEEEIASIASLSSKIPLKVIIETSMLTAEQKVEAALLAERAGAAFVKTSTGFGGGGASVEDVEMLHKVLKKSTFIKASGGIKNFSTAKAMLEAGATRLGTSAGVLICQEARHLKNFKSVDSR